MTGLIKKNVEDWVNEVSYQIDPNYVPSTFALHFINFLKLITTEQEEENLTPVLHYKMLDGIADRRQNIANMLFRGSAKTTLMAEILILYIAVYGEIFGFGDISYALYVSDSIENGVKKMRLRLQRRWDNSEFLKTYVPETKFTDIRWYFKNSEGKELVVTGHGAQALALDSVLYTRDNITTILDCKIGDEIYAPDGNLSKITAKSDIFYKPMYKLLLADGRELKVSEDHINSVLVYNKRKNVITKDLLNYPIYRTKSNGTKSYTLQIENTKPLNYEYKNFPLDPYVLGLMLGDGSMKKDGSNVLHAHKDDMKFYLTKIPYTIGTQYLDTRNNNVVSVSLLGIHPLIDELKLRGVTTQYKFIPTQYFYGSIAQRQSLLQGLIDTDGTVSKEGKVSFTSTSKQLITDIIRLVRSLGGTAKIWKEMPKTSKHKLRYKIGIWLNMHTALLPRKSSREKFNKSTNVAITEIVSIPIEASQCISINSETHQYLTNNYTRTHNTGVRGTVELGTRPQLALLDDLLSDDDARSDTVIASIEDTVYKAINYALHPTNNKIIWNGTPFNAKDPLYKAIESGAWYANVFPVCEQFPCTREEFRGAWEDRFNYDYVKKQYDTAIALGKVDTFNQELMLRIMSEEDRLIQDNEIKWYKRKTLLNNRSKFNYYITTDFATTAQTSGDYSVITVWAYNHNRDWFYVDGIVKKQLMDKNINDLFRLAQEYKPLSVGVEVSGQQAGFVSWIQNEMMVRNIYFNLASDSNNNNPGIRPVTNKLQRFNVMVPQFKSGKMYFPEELKMTSEIQEYLMELRLAAVSRFKSKHDDCLDTISMLSVMLPWAPSPEAVMTYLITGNKEDLWEVQEEELKSHMCSYIV